MENKSKKWLAAFLFIAPTIFLLVAVIRGKDRIKHPPPPPPPTGVDKVLIDKWNGQTFEDIRTNVSLVRTVEQFSFVFNEPLNDQQKYELTNAVLDFVDSYRTGTFESITKWRIPVRNFHFSQGVSNAMVARYSIPAQSVQNDSELAWRKWWWATYKDEYANYWIGISITNCGVFVEKSSDATNSLLAVLQKSNFENVGYAITAPSISFENSPERVLGSHGSITFATIRILPQVRDSEPLYPVHLRLYWSPEDGKWLPESIVCAYARSDRKRSLFF